jgi:hypothetical protein
MTWMGIILLSVVGFHKITTKRVLIVGKETGIDHLDWIYDEVTRLRINDDALLTTEIMKRVQEFNYVPTKKGGIYTQQLSLPNTENNVPDDSIPGRISHSGSLRF